MGSAGPVNQIHQGALAVKSIKSSRGRCTRRWFQAGSLVIVLFIGIQFYRFASALAGGAIPTVERPPGVEAFLPISALVSLKYYLFTGIINQIHPSGLVLFLIICLTALLFKRGFCSWICPVGLASEILARLHGAIFNHRLGLPKWLDRVFCSIKYAILGVFVWTIFLKMPLASVKGFMESPYNILADIKMLGFFTHISPLALGGITTLTVLSVVIQHFWCRYLCPYGALLGIIGFVSLGRIRRNPAVCTGCGKCERACPSMIAIREKESINSLGCSTCMGCVSVCPEDQAIGFSLFFGTMPVKHAGVALTLAALFSMGIGAARFQGHWQNRITNQEYLQLMNPQKGAAGHRRDAVIDPQKLERMGQMMKQMRSDGNAK
ncbi:MAG: 4Fe-4S binding protein [Desulfobacterium sp.]|nr:4Fe-4S binding protein [Desulfobacterium sp.]